MRASFQMCDTKSVQKKNISHSILSEGEALDDTAISEELLDDNDDLLNVSLIPAIFHICVCCI